MMTYGDGVANIDLRRLLEFHQRHGKLATVTAVRPPARFGGLAFDGDLVRRFTEKPQIGEGWINGGFFVLETPAAPPPHATSRPPLIKIGQVLRRAAIYQPALSSGLLRVSQKLGLDGSACTSSCGAAEGHLQRTYGGPFRGYLNNETTGKSVEVALRVNADDEIGVTINDQTLIESWGWKDAVEY